MNNEELANRLYDKYCQAVGGISIRGETLPSWSVFKDKAKLQSEAWVEVAKYATTLFLIETGRG